MVGIPVMVSLAIKVLTLILNIIILALYSKSGIGQSYFDDIPSYFGNHFLMTGYEIAASGIIVGFLIFNIVALISYCFGQYKEKKPLMEGIMQAVGGLSFIVIGGMGLHHWLSSYYSYGYNGISFNSYSRDVIDGNRRDFGIWMAFLSLIQGFAYFGDFAISLCPLIREAFDDY